MATPNAAPADTTAPTAAPSSAVKPGYKTTEAWIAFFGALPGLAVSTHLVPQDSPIVAVASLLLSTATSALYIWSRTRVKQAAAS